MFIKVPKVFEFSQSANEEQQLIYRNVDQVNKIIHGDS